MLCLLSFSVDTFGLMSWAVGTYMGLAAFVGVLFGVLVGTAIRTTVYRVIKSALSNIGT